MWELGRGGMGVTYKATDANLHCTVALKIIGPQCFGGEHSRSRFIREARLAAQIRHPNVAAVHHLEAEGEDIFYAMEFVDGITAEQWVKARGPMSLELALDVAMQVSRALTAADRLHLVHRDIKPGNIMLLPDPADGARVIVKVIDFGLARSLTLDSTPAVTTCAFMGTPQFASPEQIENLPLDTRSDIYSLGCVLWFLLCGEAAFNGSTARVMAQQLTSDPPFERLSHLPASVRTLLKSMLAKDPDARPQTAVIVHAHICECRASVPRRDTAEPNRRLIATLASTLRTFRPTRPVAWTALALIFLGAFAWLIFSPLFGTMVSRPTVHVDGTPVPAATDQSAPATVASIPPPAAVSQPETTSASASILSSPAPIPIAPLKPGANNVAGNDLQSFASVPAWDPPTLGLANFKDEPSPFWMPPDQPDPARDVALSNAENVSLFGTPTEAATPPKKVVTKTSPKNRRASGEGRRSSSGNPLQRAERTVRGVLNRIF